MRFLTKLEAAQGSHLVLWHGGNLDALEDNVSHKKGRWEAGPGLYLTTHYDTAKKYAKGSRKLYQVTIRKGTDIKDVLVPTEEAKDFINSFVIKKKRADILGRVDKHSRDGKLSADIFNNVMINEDALNSSNTNELRKFLVEKGGDYSVQDGMFGWRERVVVVFNTNVIVPKIKSKSTTCQQSGARMRFLSKVQAALTEDEFKKYRKAYNKKDGDQAFTREAEAVIKELNKLPDPFPIYRAICVASPAKINKSLGVHWTYKKEAYDCVGESTPKFHLEAQAHKSQLDWNRTVARGIDYDDEKEVNFTQPFKATVKVYDAKWKLVDTIEGVIGEKGKR